MSKPTLGRDKSGRKRDQGGSIENDRASSTREKRKAPEAYITWDPLSKRRTDDWDLIGKYNDDKLVSTMSYYIWNCKCLTWYLNSVGTRYDDFIRVVVLGFGLDIYIVSTSWFSSRNLKMDFVNIMILCWLAYLGRRKILIW